MAAMAQSLPALILASALAALPVVAEAGSHRSRSARAEFMRQQPCPVTGRARGPCPGYEVDHITPLKCRGADAPHNMQWLTVEQHRVKTRREAMLCRR